MTCVGCIVADLHDELGANLHAIGLLSDLSYRDRTIPEKLETLLPKLRSLAQRTGIAAHNCTDSLEATNLFGTYGDLTKEIRRTAAGLLSDLDYEIKFEGETTLQRLSARERIDICLFHKEALTNIIRHSGATRVCIDLLADKKMVHLVITDNGHGIPHMPNGGVPKSLSRRSRLLGARVQVDTPETGQGTRITLKLNNRKFLF